ncbi:hypothetical protein [Streptomyces boluensis]|uniref:Uncharacterized protein n=1 Tax=Streptomyces boluensis TaxID=1775135 RepID=A0A964UKP5_9ACTN|nr:hypothetical protein [Streptomyces boluensis]NBE50397.1 hypothetical protein [Streptomyces boluensis]
MFDMSLMAAGVAWIGLGLTVDAAGLVTYGLAALPMSAAARRQDAESACRTARRAALGLGLAGAAALLVGMVLLVLHATKFH